MNIQNRHQKLRRHGRGFDSGLTNACEKYVKEKKEQNRVEKMRLKKELKDVEAARAAKEAAEEEGAAAWEEEGEGRPTPDGAMVETAAAKAEGEGRSTPDGAIVEAAAAKAEAEAAASEEIERINKNISDIEISEVEQGLFSCQEIASLRLANGVPPAHRTELFDDIVKRSIDLRPFTEGESEKLNEDMARAHINATLFLYGKPTTEIIKVLETLKDNNNKRWNGEDMWEVSDRKYGLMMGIMQLRLSEDPALPEETSKNCFL